MDRQENRCHLQEKGCGGCPLLSIPYEEQIHMKQKEMKKLMGNFGKVRPVIGMEYPGSTGIRQFQPLRKDRGVS